MNANIIKPFHMDKRREKNLIKLREWKKRKGFFVPCKKQNDKK